MTRLTSARIERCDAELEVTPLLINYNARSLSYVHDTSCCKRMEDYKIGIRTSESGNEAKARIRLNPLRGT